MSPIKKPASSSQDYGRRPEMKGGKDAPDFKGHLHGGGKSGTYRELIGRGAESTVLQRAVASWKKHSEFKKPYLSDEFPEMEHYYAKPVNFPGSEYSPYDADGVPSQCWDVCKKNHSGVYFDDDCYVYVWMDRLLTLRDNEVIIDSSYTVAMVQIDDVSIAGTMRKVFKSVSDVGANINVIWTVFQPLFEACPGVDEIHARSCRKTYDKTATCATVEWDYTTSAETIVQNQDPPVIIAVIYGTPPYSWSVSGTGFSLGSTTTSGVTNTLDADGSACGTAVITVTDASGDTAVGGVRCTTGVWGAPDPNCVALGGGLCSWIQDGFRYTIGVRCANDGTSPWYNPCNAPNTFGCKEPVYTTCTDAEGSPGDWYQVPCWSFEGCDDPSNPEKYLYRSLWKVEPWNCA